MNNEIDQPKQTESLNQPILFFIGFGVVGQAVYNGLTSEAKENVYITDPNKIIDPKHHCDPVFTISESRDKYPDGIIFLSVPTSIGIDIQAEYNPELVIYYLDELYVAGYKGLVIIKSTVLYKDIIGFINKLKIIYWPEFLSDITPSIDFINETDIIVGSDMMEQDTIRYCGQIHSLFDHIENIDYLSLSDAINFKFIRNSYIAWKITFWNMIADSSLIDQRTLKKLMQTYPLNSEMNEIALDGKPGYGGKCLPKDFNAFGTTVSDKAKIMFEAANAFNNLIRK